MGPNPQETADLVTFTEDILNGKLHFLCSEEVRSWKHVVSLLVIIYTETTFLILYYLFPEAQIMVGKSIQFIFHC